MLNEIMDGITRRLDSLFPDCRIYTELVEQELEEPCFFLTFLEPVEKPVMGRRYCWMTGVSVQYLPGECPETAREFNRVAELLMDGLEMIALADGRVIRGTDRSAKPDAAEKSLIFFISYHVYHLKTGQPSETMEDLTADVKKGMGNRNGKTGTSRPGKRPDWDKV